MSKFGIQVELGNLKILYPKGGNEWMVQVFLQAGYKGNELKQLNRVRIYIQVAFLSNILCSQGKAFYERYLTPRNA